MTTHLRARAAQAGALLALIVGGVSAVPAAALAAPSNVSVQITNVSPTDVLAGGAIQLHYTVSNNGDAGGAGGPGQADSLATVHVTGMSCSGDCSPAVAIPPGNNKQFTAKLTAPQVAPGSTQTVTVTVSVTTATGGQDSKQQQITVRGPDRPQTVTAITGKVRDQDGKGIPGASVAARDSAGNTFPATTNGSGAFSINGSETRPIAPGNIELEAAKAGYNKVDTTVQGVAGRTLTVTLNLRLVAASSSASPSSSPSTGNSAATDPLDTTVPSVVAKQPNDGAATKKTSQDSGSGSMLFVIIGGLLVAAGVGAIVLVLMRRRNASGKDGGDNDPTAMGGGPAVVPPSQGRFNDATRVASPVGAGPAAATMVAPRSGAPSMADAPTMLQSPVPAVEDEFPDPYGAPLPPQGGYAGAAAGGWDNNQGAGQYGAPTQYGPPADEYAGGQYGGGQYAAPAGQERFDEHTSLYRPESDQDGYGEYDQGGYGAAPHAAAEYGGANAGGGEYGGGTYGGGHAGADGQFDGGHYDDGQYAEGYHGGGYGQEPAPADQGGYGAWGAPAGADSGNGYGPPVPGQGGGQGGAYGGGTYGGAAAPGGTYGGGQQYGGYDQQGGYEQGYDQHGGQYSGAEYGGPANGHAPQPGAQQHVGGYDQYDEQTNAGYGNDGGYDDRQQPARRGPRRPDGY